MATWDGTQRVIHSQSSSADLQQKWVDVGGRRLHIFCAGSGSPTVIIERGFVRTAPPLLAPVWRPVQMGAAAFTRVCLYNRANFEGSDPDPRPVRTGANVVEDLHWLLQHARESPPYVLVGHSLGGVFARMYANEFPRQVAGMVLVDSSHEDQIALFVAASSNEKEESFPPQRENVERLDVEETFNQLRRMRWRTSIPLTVFVGAATVRQTEGYRLYGEDRLTRLDEAWHDMQRDLARRSTSGRLIIAERSGHFVQRDEPELVVKAIRDVVAEVRKNRQGNLQ